MLRSSNNARVSFKRVAPLLIISVILLLVVIWFRRGLILGGGEGGLSFYRFQRLFSLNRYVWFELSLGGSVVNAILTAPFYLFGSIFEHLGISDVWLQAATYFGLVAVGAISVYELTRREIPGGGAFSGTMAALFYVLNPFAMNSVWHRFINSFPFFYALLPLALLLFMRGLRLKKLSYAFSLNMAMLLFSYSFSQIPLLGTIWIVLLSYLLFFILTNYQDRRCFVFALKFGTLSVFLFLLLNMWWIPVFIAGWDWLSGVSYGTQPSTVEQLRNVSVLYGLRAIEPFYTYVETNFSGIFSSPLFEIIAFLIPVIVFSSLLYKKKSRGLLYFASLAILGIFLAKGGAPPLEGIFKWAFTHIRHLLGFRNAFEKLGLIFLLGFAPLFGVGVHGFYCVVRKRAKPILAAANIALLCFLVMGLYVWPMWTGVVFTSSVKPTNDLNIGYSVEVPAYYSLANSWAKNSIGASRIISLPFVGTGVTYNWRFGYAGAELSTLLFDSPVVSGVSALVPHNEIITSNLEGVLQQDRITFFKMAGLINAKYIIVHHDMDYQIRQLTAPSQIIGALKPMRPVKTFGKLDIYEIGNEFFLPHIYAATEPKLLVQDVDDFLGAIRETDTSSLRRTVFFLLQPGEAITTLEAKKFPMSGVQPKLDFEMLSPVAYRVKIKEAKGPFHLVLSESYHPQWKAYKGNVSWFQALWEKPISGERHWRANGYANSWYFDEKGDYTVTLFFWPQSLVYLGYVIAIITFLGCIGVLSYKRLKGVMRNR